MKLRLSTISPKNLVFESGSVSLKASKRSVLFEKMKNLKVGDELELTLKKARWF